MLIHGGDVSGFALRYGNRPLDFSASVNPFGPPDGVRESICQAVRHVDEYPDPLCRALARDLSLSLDVPAAHLFFGNGAAEVIYRFVQATRPQVAVVPVPTFAEYELALSAHECQTLRPYPLSADNGFLLTEDFLPHITREVDVVFLCQPNNPTSRLAPDPLVDAIIARAKQTETRVFLDQSFCRFTDNWERHYRIRHTTDNPHLFLLDSFTKLYALAGLRLGYGVSSDGALLDAVRHAGQPWAVSSLAQTAGRQALKENSYVESTLAALHSAKESLVSGLKKAGMTVFGHDANFVFFTCKRTHLDRELMEDGILIRNCCNFRGLAPGFFRVSVRKPEENDRLLAAIARHTE